ncbi:MAG: 5-oxoprolinase subunit PxpB [Pyrinomonadaceae bacterium]
MTDGSFRMFPLGDSALTIEFGNTISVDLNRRAIALAGHFQQNPFPGFIESVPAYASTTLFYDLLEVRREFAGFPSAFEAVRSLAVEALNNLNSLQNETPRLIEIPVHFDAESAPDLEFVAKRVDLSSSDVIDIFTAVTYRVFMLGFLPGFTYMGEVDERIATPRLETPRTRVPKGSVGIAGRQTGIYSLRCPGGWQIIGRTDVEMFTPDEKLPSLLQPGDEVRFVTA